VAATAVPVADPEAELPVGVAKLDPMVEPPLQINSKAESAPEKIYIAQLC
jgi:hypothetical protein